MLRRPAFTLLALCFIVGQGSAEEPVGVDDPQIGYYTTAPTDRFTRWNDQLKSGTRTLDTRDELSVLQSVLTELGVPVSSQMLVYSVTSLQKNLISPRRPRALYFNDDTYVAFVPGGRIEVISVDPVLGSIFYISDRVRPGQTPRFQRSQECMNCHAPHYLENIPALVLESVVPGLTGGGERASRRERSGHDIPLSDRFGGWHLTGTGANFPGNWANKLIDRREGVAHELENPLGQRFDTAAYLRPTSDVLPQLLQEHQTGFVNRATLAAYRTRRFLRGHEKDSTSLDTRLKELAEPLVRYLLLADEVSLPPGSVPGDPEYKTAFLADRRPDSTGAALKDLDLQTRLFRYRCSYMIYSPTFAGLPGELKREIYLQLSEALVDPGTPAGAKLSVEEKRTIRSILAATLPDFPVEQLAAAR